MPRGRVKLTSDLVENYGRFLPPSDDHVVKIYPAECTVTVKSFNDEVLARSSNALLVTEIRFVDGDPPTRDYGTVYYFPPDSINWYLFRKSSTVTYSPFKEYAIHYSIRDAPDLASQYQHPYKQVEALKALIAFYSSKVD